MKLDALDHPKTLDFAARLNVELPTAIGHLELFFAFVAKKAPQGNVGKWPDGAIARACYWNHDPAVFIVSLADAGFIDRDAKHRFLVHDWRDHAPRWVLAKLAKAKEKIIGNDCSGDSSTDCSADCSEDSSGDSVRQGKASLGKGSKEQEREQGTPTLSRRISECPRDMDAEAEYQAATEYYSEEPSKAEWRSWVLRAVKSGIYAKRPVPRPTDEEIRAERRRIIEAQNAA